MAVFLSGVYPLFRRSAADLQGAALRVHITLTASSVPVEVAAVPAGVDPQMDSDSQEEILSEKIEAADGASSIAAPNTSESRPKNTSSRTPPDITSVQHTGTSMDESFPVTVEVDRAMHLNLKGGQPEFVSIFYCYLAYFVIDNNDVCDVSLAGCPIAERSEGSPCCCVSFVTADSAEPVSTAVIANTDCPVWDHQHECRSSYTTDIT